MGSEKKVNSINGELKRHSVIGELSNLVDRLTRETPVKRIGSKIIHHYHHVPSQPIDIISFETKEKIKYIEIRAYGETAYQDFFLYCEPKDFSKVINWINHFCKEIYSREETRIKK